MLKICCQRLVTISVALVVAFIVALTDAAQVGVQSEKAPLRIVTSIRPLMLMAQDLVGDQAEVKSLLSAGDSPHHYSLRMSDRVALEQADLLIWIGEDFERFLAGVMTQTGSSAVLTVTSVAGLKWPLESVHNHHVDHSHGEKDQHIWFDPRNAMVIMDALASHLIALRPELKPQIQQRLTITKQRLRAVYDKAYRELQTLPRRPIAARHDAYGHLLNALGLAQGVALVQVPDQALSAKHMAFAMAQVEHAACVLIDVSEPLSKRQKLQDLLKRPVIAIDPLGLEKNNQSYLDLLNAWVESLKSCLATREAVK